MKNGISIVLASLLILIIFGPIGFRADPIDPDQYTFAASGPPAWGDPLEMDMNISYAAEGSFVGEKPTDMTGFTPSRSGDFNGDGIDDILIGGQNSDTGGDDGAVYVIFGKNTGWNQNISLSNADASFVGENPGDASLPMSLDSAGDVNGDGYDDIMIGFPSNQEVGPNSGQTYLIFGKSTGWTMDTSLSNSDASFRGENPEDWSGSAVAGLGDTNGDGYDDILIGAYLNDGGGVDRGSSYLIFGKSSGWTMDTGLSNADVIITGEGDGDQAGFSVAGPGNVNGDDHNDILIGAELNDDGGVDAGQSYVIFGRSSGWSSTISLSNSDASFEGENVEDLSGHVVKGAGDVNGDGNDDMLFSSFGWGEKNRGKVHLVLGKSSGWSMNSDLANSDASFLGEYEYDLLGESMGGGDIDGDALSDIVIGSPGNSENYDQAGQVYVFLGRSSGWQNDVNATNADASFLGETTVDQLGMSLGVIGDVNSDGTDDLLIGCQLNDIGGFDAGKTYLVTGSVNTEPTEVYTFEAYSVPYSDPSRVFDIGARVYLELTGEDGNASYPDAAMVNISFQKSPLGILRVGLRETGMNTGIYRGFFLIPQSVLYFDILNLAPSADPSFAIDLLSDYPFRPSSVSSVTVYENAGLTTTTEILDYGETAYFVVAGEDANPTERDKAFLNLSSDKNGSFTPLLVCREIGINTGLYVGSLIISDSMVWFENVTATSVRDHTKTDVFKVHTPIQLRPFEDNRTAYEDQEYREEYWNFGWVTNPNWKLTTDRDWIEFDPVSLELYGTPDNTELGLTTVELNLSDNDGHFSVHNFRIFVFNSDPMLIGEDLLEIDQGEHYKVDYNCNDDGQGEITYYLTTSVDWLEMDPNTGVLSGVPSNDDVGEVMVSISVTDGNDGWDSRQFNIIVHNVNDAPVIITEDIVSVYQDEPFVRNYQAEDIDVGDEIRWELGSDAGFLSIDNEAGTLSGETGYMDVGTYFVNVSVWDLSDAFDFHNFTLEVLNVNDIPVWIDFPDDLEVIHGETFLFDVNALDHDDDMLTYYISSSPDSDIKIDEFTGLINWTADIHLFDQAPHKLEVKISVRDGHVYSNRTFTITVIPTRPPTVELIGPANGVRSPSSKTVLMWEGTDPEDEPITYDIYLHQTEAFVQGYREEALHEEGFEGTNITLTGLTPGERFFWTVIPSDGVSLGICTSGVQSFRVNYKPTFRVLEDHEVPAGTDFKYKISCTDEDSEDLPNLRYSLVEAPNGMTISEETGMIRWTPNDDQVMLHTVTVQVSDGIESNTASFEIDVKKGERSSSSSVFIFIIIAVVVLLLIALGIFFFIKQKKKIDEEALRRGEEERAALEKEKKDDTPSYEELYGIPAPVMEEEEGMTTGELKGFIHEQIEELEEKKGEE